MQLGNVLSTERFLNVSLNPDSPNFITGVPVNGSQHMLFGTDLPWGNTPGILGNVVSLNVPEEEKGMILGGNAAKLFGIR